MIMPQTNDMQPNVTVQMPNVLQSNATLVN